MSIEQLKAANISLLKNAETIDSKKSFSSFTNVIAPTEKTIDTTFLVMRKTQNGSPVFIKKVTSGKKLQAYSKNPNKIKYDTANAAVDFINQINNVLGWKTNSNPFKIANIIADSLGKTHVKFDQYFKGHKIHGAAISVHLNNMGQGEVFTGNYADTASLYNAEMHVSLKKALDIMNVDLEKRTKVATFTKQELQLLNYNGPKVDTVFYKTTSTGPYKLVYKILVRANLINEFEYFIDALNGEIVKFVNKTCTIDGSSAGYSLDLKGQSVKVNSYQQGAYFYLWDVTKPMYANTEKGVIKTYDARYSNVGNIKTNEIFSLNNEWLNSKAVSAHNNASKVYDYFKNVHGRNSIDNNGGNIISIINVTDNDSSAFDNAFYSYPVIVYGNGKTYFKPLAGALDVAAHEISHGVINFSAQLEYTGQSGALSESFADIFGAMVDSSNWTIGEDIVQSNYFPSGALRSLADPHNGASKFNNRSWQPKHMNEYMMLPESENGDWGGVHTNSGIINHAFYLLATSFVGREAAAKIFYRALTNYLNSYAQFIDLRYAAIQSAEDLYDASYVQKVKDIFDNVGIHDVLISNVIETVLPVNEGDEHLLNYKYGNSQLGIYNNNFAGANTAVSMKEVINKPSVTDDGQLLVFVGADHKIYGVHPDLNANQSITVIQSDSIWSSVAIAKDGKRISATTIFDDTSIYVFESSIQQWKKFKLFNPSNSHGLKNSLPVFADMMEWDYNGEYIYYDALNNIPTNGKQFWDINKVKVWDNAAKNFTNGNDVQKIKQLNIENGDNIGNPVLAKTTPYVIAFDYFNSNKTNSTYILGLDLLQNKLDTIVRNNTIGYPSFNKFDNQLAYVTINKGNYSINTIELASDKISTKNAGRFLIDSANWPIYIANGSRSFEMPETPEITPLSDINFCENSSIQLTSNMPYGNHWYINGILSTADTSNTIVVKQSGIYTLKTVVNGVSSLISNSIQTNMIPAPEMPQLVTAASIQYCMNIQANPLEALPLPDHKLIWYDSYKAKGIASSIAITPSTENVGYYDYYVSQRSLMYGCESTPAKITVKINALPTVPTLQNYDTIKYCYQEKSVEIKATSSNNHQLIWYDANKIKINNGASVKLQLTNIGVATYFVSQQSMLNGCESNPAKVISQVIAPPSVPIVKPVYLCEGDIAKSLNVNALKAHKIIWYENQGNAEKISFIPPIPSTESAKETNYYFAQLNENTGCISNKAVLPVVVKSKPNIPVITRNDSTGMLLSSESNNNIWFKDGIQLFDTMPILKPIVSGNYSVQTSLNGCTSLLSDNYFCFVKPLSKNATANEYVAYAPNPFVDQLKIDFLLNGYDKINLEVTEFMTGKKVDQRLNIIKGQTLYFPNLKGGIYICRFYSSDNAKNFVFKVIKVQ